jgi:hypothetical protein
MLVIPPTEIIKRSFDAVLDHLLSFKTFEKFHFHLNTIAKVFFELTAIEQGFINSHRYLTFIKSLFPQGESARSNLMEVREYSVL